MFYSTSFDYCVKITFSEFPLSTIKLVQLSIRTELSTGSQYKFITQVHDTVKIITQMFYSTSFDYCVKITFSEFPLSTIKLVQLSIRTELSTGSQYKFITQVHDTVKIRLFCTFTQLYCYHNSQ